MSRTDTDILISGAGIAGMVLAATLARRGWRITLVDPSPPPASAETDGSDLRSTAYLGPSCAVLEQAGLWHAMAPEAVPLAALRVVDSRDWPPVQTDSRTFTPQDVARDAFGWNIPNWRARQVLSEQMAALDGIDLRLGVGFKSLLARDSDCHVRLSDGSRLRAKLVIGADGRASPVREAAGIEVTTKRYGQKALAFAVTHDIAHQNVSTEIYNAGGAFTTVPLGDRDGQPASAIVWMNDGRRNADLLAMPQDAFEAEMADRALHLLGRMRLASPLRSWPVITQTAKRLTARRVVLVAEAAHVLPPIGAQGLNTSIADIAALADALDATDPGRADALEAYAKSRARDIHLRAGVIDLFNRVCQSDMPAIQRLRTDGLRAVHDIAPLRKRIMVAGMGAAQNT